jgi:hypothetical protein
MFTRLWERLHAFQDHHQILFALVAAFAVISASWGLQKLLETFLFPNKPIYGSILALCIGLGLLWITKHVIMQEF